MPTQLPLTNSRKHAVIDSNDSNLTKKVKSWSLNNSGYVQGRISGGGKVVFLHRLVMKHKLVNAGMPNAHVDHIDRNKLNNKKSNLRVVTPSTNQKNKA